MSFYNSKDQISSRSAKTSFYKVNKSKQQVFYRGIMYDHSDKDDRLPLTEITSLDKSNYKEIYLSNRGASFSFFISDMQLKPSIIDIKDIKTFRSKEDQNIIDDLYDIIKKCIIDDKIIDILPKINSHCLKHNNKNPKIIATLRLIKSLQKSNFTQEQISMILMVLILSLTDAYYLRSVYDEEHFKETYHEEPDEGLYKLYNKRFYIQKTIRNICRSLMGNYIKSDRIITHEKGQQHSEKLYAVSMPQELYQDPTKMDQSTIRALIGLGFIKEEREEGATEYIAGVYQSKRYVGNNIDRILLSLLCGEFEYQTIKAEDQITNNNYVLF